MTNLERIERDVESLSPDELAEFRAWFHTFDALAWDEKLEVDVATGRLDALRDEVIKDHKAGRTREP